jgi:hypothetical protein
MNTVIYPLIPILIALVQVFKEAGLPPRYCPLLSILFGVGLSFVIQIPVLEGLVAGVSAVGLYSGVRATANQ